MIGLVLTGLLLGLGFLIAQTIGKRTGLAH